MQIKIGGKVVGKVVGKLVGKLKRKFRHLAENWWEKMQFWWEIKKKHQKAPQKTVLSPPIFPTIWWEKLVGEKSTVGIYIHTYSS